MNRYAALAIALVCVSAEATAGVEFGGTMGLHIFNEKNAVGEPDVPGDQRVSFSNSAMFGVRLGYYFSPMLGIEVEGGFIPGETRAGENDTTPLVAASAITYRAQLVAQFGAANPAKRFIPFVFAGGGMFQIVDSENEEVIKKDSTPLFYGGAGVKYRTKDGWLVRVDGRILFVKKSGGAMEDPSGLTQDFEILIGIGKDFGAKKVVAIKTETPPPTVDQDPDKDGIVGAADKCPNEPEDKDNFQDEDGCPDPDNDGDGIADATDKCPAEAEDKDNFQDEDGCPDPDNDGDGIADATDKCPAEAEDKDNFQDEDGCPDPDNDQDGVPDAADKCNDKPETRNGFEDEDGCPDEIPEKLRKFTGVIQGITFKVNSVELIGGSAKTLDAAVAVLAEFKDAKLEIQGHTDDQPLKKGGKFESNEQLSQGRADSVKAYMVSKGIDASRLTSKGYGDTAPVEAPAGLKAAKLNAARAKNRRVEFKLVTGEEAPAAPAPAPEAPKDEKK
jgi:outer membrane protein OmpA-like peptidoglycan-associated protein/outer membrane protein W